MEGAACFLFHFACEFNKEELMKKTKTKVIVYEINGAVHTHLIANGLYQSLILFILKRDVA